MIKNNIVRKESAGGLILSKGKILLIKDLDSGTYEIPKGGLLSGETKEDACVREIREETGYPARVIAYLSTTRFLLNWKDGNTYDKIIHYYALELIDADQEPRPAREVDENFENSWVTYDEALELLIHEDALEALRLAKVYSV